MGEHLQTDWGGNFSIDFGKIAAGINEELAAGGYVTLGSIYKKEDKMADVFDDLKSVFGIGQDFENASDFYKSLHYAAEGIRQHDALHRVTDAFSYSDAVLDNLGRHVEWIEDDEAKTDSKTTTIIGGNEEEK